MIKFFSSLILGIAILITTPLIIAGYVAAFIFALLYCGWEKAIKHQIWLVKYSLNPRAKGDDE